MVDCPHRERMGYGGDAHATTETALNSFHLGRLLHQVGPGLARRARGEPRPGASTSRPARRRGRSGRSRQPALHRPHLLGRRRAGLVRLLRHAALARISPVRRRPHPRTEGFPTIQRWLAFLESKSAGDMLVRWGGEWDFLGDWLWPGARGVNGDTPETLVLQQLLLDLQPADGGADRRRARQPRSGRAPTASRAEAVRRAVHAKFFRPEDNSYVNGLQAYLAIALWPLTCRRRPAAGRLETPGRRNPRPPQGSHPRRHHRRILRHQEICDRRPGRPDLRNGHQGRLSQLGRHAPQRGDHVLGIVGRRQLSACTAPTCTWACGSSKGWPASGPIPGGPASSRLLSGRACCRAAWITVRARYDSLYGPIVVNWNIEGGKLRKVDQRAAEFQCPIAAAHGRCRLGPRVGPAGGRFSGRQAGRY